MSMKKSQRRSIYFTRADEDLGHDTHDLAEEKYSGMLSSCGTSSRVGEFERGWLCEKVLHVCATFCFVASASRQARGDGGLPFSNVFQKIDDHWHIPIFTIALTGTINLLSGLLYLGSSVAFVTTVSLTTASYLSSYLIPITLMILRRLRSDTIKLGPWTLGRWGLPINIFAAVYTLITVIFSFLPPSVDAPINATNMNYSGLVYGGVMLLGIAYYVMIGHCFYVGPNVQRTRRWTTEHHLM